MLKKHSDAVNLARLTLSEAGALVLNYTTGGFKDENGRLIRVGQPGASDLVACHQGRALFVEIKVGRDVWRPEQQSFAKAVEAAGGRYVLARWTDKEDGTKTIKMELEQ